MFAYVFTGMVKWKISTYSQLPSSIAILGNICSIFYELKIVGVGTNGAANMTGNQRGVVTKMEHVDLPGFHEV